MDAEKCIAKLKEEIMKTETARVLPPATMRKLKELMKYTDIRLNVLKVLSQVLKEKQSVSGVNAETWMKNILRVIGTVASRENFGIDEFYNENDSDSGKTVEENYSEFKKRFSEVWALVMKWKMTPSVHKQIVILLPDRIMVHLTKPLHMSSFLLESFKMGGPVGLISLHGIFLLMQKYNFEVPDFYTKLFSMFTLEVLYSKYRARFFAYSRDFLSSTHLPEYFVGAVVKKLARLSLHAPAPAIPMICDFITNLMIEHPGLKTLVNKKPVFKYDDGSFADDPYDPDEIDPLKCRALDSCLWELKTLQHHVLPTVALSARFISKTLPKLPKDLDDTLSMTYDDILEKEQAASGSLEPIPNHVVHKFTSEDRDNILMEH